MYYYYTGEFWAVNGVNNFFMFEKNIFKVFNKNLTRNQVEEKHLAGSVEVA